MAVVLLREERTDMAVVPSLRGKSITATSSPGPASPTRAGSWSTPLRQCAPARIQVRPRHEPVRTHRAGARPEHPPGGSAFGGSGGNGAAADRVSGGLLLRRTERSRVRMPAGEETHLLDGVGHLPFRVAGGMLCSYWNTLWGSYCALISRNRSKLEPQ